MMYALDDLLMKMGAPETREKGQIRWHYFNGDNNEIGGFAEVRLLDGGETLVAELQQWHPVESVIGATPDGKDMQQTESLYLHARRTGHCYAVTKIAFDGEEYPHPQKPIIELGLSIFHARALDISILMVEQAFNRQDIVHQERAVGPMLPASPRADVAEDQPRCSTATKYSRRAALMPQQAQTGWGVVVPFRPRRRGASFSMS